MYNEGKQKGGKGVKFKKKRSGKPLGSNIKDPTTENGYL